MIVIFMILSKTFWLFLSTDGISEFFDPTSVVIIQVIKRK